MTGEKNLRRADLIEDIGTSISPEVDVGQLEGAFVMSLGELYFFRLEKLILSKPGWLSLKRIGFIKSESSFKNY